ncbi:MAG TPA: hemolysin family protein [Gemmatimonadaceae bacterium]|nr:hemolysin family protein [Gemmatimonadaceae bacterium]
MTIAPWLLCALAALVGAACSVADGALLAFDPSASPAEHPGGAIHERERAHRALSALRVLAYVVAGASIAQGLTITGWSFASRALAALGLSVVLVALTEGMARSIGYGVGSRAYDTLHDFVRATTLVLRPVVALGSALERVLQRVLPATDGQAEAENSTERFREVVAAEADVSSAEEELLHGVFSLGDTEVREIMVPRVDIVGIAATTPWSEVLDRVRSSEHARFPVYDDTLDNVIGILYAKDLLGAIVADEEPKGGWLRLVRGAVFIPTTKTIDGQLRDFKDSRTHIAIVSDEYGGTAGLVTIEDVLEEIVGEIRDEYDVEEPDVEREGGARFWVAGRVSIDELRELMGVDFGVHDVATVGGLVYALFGRVPRAGEAITRAGVRIVVERVRRRRIERVYFERLQPALTAGGPR